MTKKIRYTISTLLSMLMLFSATSSVVFALGQKTESDGHIIGNTADTGGGTSNNRTTAVLMVPSLDTKTSSAYDENGKVIAGGDRTMKEHIMAHDFATPEDLDEYKNSFIVGHKMIDNGDGKMLHYTRDMTHKTYDHFLPDNASPEMHALFKYAFEKLDKANNGDYSSGRKGMTYLAISKETYKEFLEKGGEIPKEMKEMCKDELCLNKPKTPKPTPQNPDKPKKEIERVVCDVGSGPTYSFTGTQGAGGGEFSGVYSIVVTVSPQKPVNFDKLPVDQQEEWARTHHNQVIGPIKTAWGEYLDSNREFLASLAPHDKSGGIAADSTYRRSWEAFAAGASEALSKPLPDPEVVLSEANLKGAARGAVFTYTQHRKTASVSASHYQDKYDQYGCERESYVHYYWANYLYQDHKGNWHGGYVPETRYRTVYRRTRTNVDIDGNFTKTPIRPVISGGYTPYKSYQTVTVKCNEELFSQLVERTGSSILEKLDASQFAKSPTIAGSVASYYNHLDIDFFYNGRSCDDIYGCEVVPPSFPDDRANNKVNNGKFVREGKYGAQIDDKISDEFVIFRDNLYKTIRNDVWYPKFRAGTGLSYDNHAAHRSYFILDKNGTPQEEFFTLADEGENVLLRGVDMSTKWYFSLPGQVNKLNWKASWTSDPQKPHKVNVGYGYKPISAAKVVRGFRENDVTYTEVSTEIDMICPMIMNSNTAQTPIVHHKPKPLTTETFKEFNDTEGAYYSVNFVKSSAE